MLQVLQRKQPLSFTFNVNRRTTGKFNSHLSFKLPVHQFGDWPFCQRTLCGIYLANLFLEVHHVIQQQDAGDSNQLVTCTIDLLGEYIIETQCAFVLSY